MLKTLHSLGLSVLIASAASLASAQDLKMSSALSEAGQWTLMASPLTFHYSDINRDESEEKHSYVWLVGAEKMLNERYFAGAAFFSNSFGQPTQYVYAGAKFRPWEEQPKFFTKISAGIIHGYKPPYDKKIPINTSSGWGLGVIPSIGWDFNNQFATQLNVLGAAGLMLQLNVTLK
ncbi:MAG: hypothetical protein RL018_1991 [Pseudomonadota bacterium]